MEQPKIKIGQIWQEVDNRFTRYVEIISCVSFEGRVRIRSIDTGRETEASAHRFNGKKSGYRYIRDSLIDILRRESEQCNLKSR